MRRSNEPRIYGPYKHGDVYRLHVVVGRSGGGRQTVYRVYPTRDLAEAALKGARDQAQGTTVKQAVDAFIADMRTRTKEPTVVTAGFRLKHLLGQPANSERPLRWIANRGAELYAAAQVKRAADTHQNELAKAKEFGAFCVAKKWLRANPFASVTPVGRKTHGGDKVKLTVDETRKLQAHCHTLEADPAAVACLAYLLLGPRASELVKRDVRDLDDRGRLLWISHTKTKRGTRRLVIPDELRPLLLELAGKRAPDAPLFLTDKGARPSRDWARYHVKRLCKDAKVPVVPPQALRRTHAVLATDAGMAGPMVSAHLGHERTAVTQQSYVGRAATEDARNERVFRVIAGGRP